MLLYLIGMMFSGKSTIGLNLSKRLDYHLVDTDTAIEQTTGKTIKDIIKEEGIDFFRQLEAETLRNIAVDINTVIATGGGIILNEDNVLFMKSNGVVIYLDIPLEVLQSRSKEIGTANRPLLIDEHSLATIFHERKSLYEKACEIKINCGTKGIDEITLEIIKKLT